MSSPCDTRVASMQNSGEREKEREKEREREILRVPEPRLLELSVPMTTFEIDHEYFRDTGGAGVPLG